MSTNGEQEMIDVFDLTFTLPEQVGSDVLKTLEKLNDHEYEFVVKQLFLVLIPSLCSVLNMQRLINRKIFDRES